MHSAATLCNSNSAKVVLTQDHIRLRIWSSQPLFEKYIRHNSLLSRLIILAISLKMPSRSRLAAAAFNDGQSNYRVFYQDSSFLLKESCFEDSKGWYIRENCIVANDAKKYTSLAAVSWADGNEVSLPHLDSLITTMTLRRNTNLLMVRFVSTT